MEPELRRDIWVCSMTFEIHKKAGFSPLCSPLGKGKEESTGSSFLALLCDLWASCLPFWASMVPPVNCNQNFVIKNPLLGVQQCL